MNIRTDEPIRAVWVGLRGKKTRSTDETSVAAQITTGDSPGFTTPPIFQIFSWLNTSEETSSLNDCEIESSH